MSENYTQAALRHWRDAELLKENERTENADHHYGIAGECAIKHALLHLPAFATNGALLESYKEHIDVLWNRVNHQSLQKAYPGLLAVLKSGKHFEDWNVSQRYSADSDVSVATMQAHRNAALQLIKVSNLAVKRRR